MNSPSQVQAYDLQHVQAESLVQDIYPLSPLQQGLLFHCLAEPEVGLYVEQLSCELVGPLRREVFWAAWQAVVDAQTVLRTGIEWEGLEEPLQLVYQQAELPTDEQDWRGLPEDEQERRWQVYLQEDARRGFALEVPPLMRLALARRGEDRHYFLWSQHHIIVDGWCQPLILRDVFDAYASLAADQNPRPPARRPYRDYIAWLKAADLDAAEAYWRSRLAGFTEPTRLALPPETGKEGGGQQSCYLSSAATARAGRFCQAT